MKMIDRNYCVISGQKGLEPLYCFKNFPVFMGCLDTPQEQDLVADMGWHISRHSGSIQLNPLLPLDVLYPESHGAGCVGKLWDSHHQAFAEFVARYRPQAVLEIGGSHGILAKKYHALENIPWTILEPNPTPVEGCEANFIRGFFDNYFVYDGALDTLVHSHVFEHIYEPGEFMANISTFMEPGQKLIFSLPNLQIMLERKYTNCINFEHTVFLTEPYVDYLLSRYGFRVVDKQFFMDDHSIFYSAVRDPGVQPVPMPSHLYGQNRQLYMDYVAYHEALIRDLNQKIATLSQPVYLFGAHVFAQYLMAFGLDTSRIVSLLDNDSKKQGRRLSGTHLRVQSPRVLASEIRPVIILKAGVYNQEIRQDILENINPGAEFLE